MTVYRSIHAAGALALAGAGTGMGIAAISGVTGVSGSDPAGWAALFAVVVVPLGYVAARETRWALRTDEFDVTRTDLGNAVAVAAGAPVTYVLSIEVGLGPVVASALVGLLAYVLSEKYAAPAYCGSFVGMATPAAGADVVAVSAAGVVSAGVFVAAKRGFNGFGGKLGTTAFIGCLAVAALGGFGPGSGTVPAGDVAAVLVVVAALAAAATFVVSVGLDHGPVVGSAIIGLLAGLVCPPLLAAGDTVAAVAFCASFAGMATPERIPGTGAMIVAGAVSGLVFVGAAPYFVGFGGKLGTIAFTACLFTAGIRSLGKTLVPSPLAGVSG